MLEDDVAEIVHDLRNPLSVIALEAIILDGRLGSGDREAGMRSVSRIQHNVSYLDRLVQDLLDMCAFTVGQFELCKAPAELRALLERVIDRVADRARVILDAPRRLTLLIDELRIERVLGNLIDNALKYTVGLITVRCTADPRRAYVSVTDCGPGISARDLGHIFLRHHRGETAAKHAGLFVAKKIVEAHDGRIGVESKRGAGTRFFFELPIT